MEERDEGGSFLERRLRVLERASGGSQFVTFNH
jgi:hypothetical protein